jgi:hypothetical protein
MQHPTLLAALPPSYGGTTAVTGEEASVVLAVVPHGEVVFHMEKKFEIFVAKKSSIDAKSTEYL